MSKCPCQDCAADRTTRITPLGTVKLGVAQTSHDRLIATQQRRNNRGKAGRKGGRRGR